MSNELKIERFGAINLADTFFDSLKADYPGFENWFARKVDEEAYLLRDDDGEIEGFLYLKREDGSVEDVNPPLASAKRLKIGTFKIEGRGTKLGERFLKKIFDRAIVEEVDEIYVTVFPKHGGLTRLFDKYGFVPEAKKPASNGDEELVMVRALNNLSGDIVKDYPFINVANCRKFLLAIYPKWHTELLPDSILKTEHYNVVRDLSHTNSIHKIYITQMGVEVLQRGDVLVMYRTKEPNDPGSAEYRSVATSIVVVEDAKRASDFGTEKEFLDYCEPFSVFKEAELKSFYAAKSKWRVIKFTYNAAMSRRLIRKELIENVGLDRKLHWNFIPLSNLQFRKIVELGGVNENLIVN